VSEHDAQGLYDRLRQWREQQSAVRLRDGAALSLEALAARLCSDDERALQAQLAVLHDLPSFRLPVVAVCGLMNSGKSSTVAYHLSPAGRARVNIGDTSAAGTHRFVLWLPERWRDQLSGWAERLAEIFGKPPEYLADDPEAAHAQYNAAGARTERFDVPLLAHDPALDSLGLALLDCPDIQRSHDPAARVATAAVRAAMLERAAALCSAFVVVSSVEQQETEDLATLFARIGALQTPLPLFYVLTKTGADVARYANEAQQRLQALGVADSVRAVFLCPRIHDAPPEGFIPALDYQNAQPDGPSLESALLALDPSSLYAGLRQRTLQRVAALERTVFERIQAHFARNAGLMQQVREALLLSLRHGLRRDGVQRIFLTPAMVDALQASFLRTAPLAVRAMKPLLALRRRLGGRESPRGQSLEQLTPELLASHLTGRPGITLSESELSKLAAQVLQTYGRHLSEHGAQELDSQALDRATRAFWAQEQSDRRKAEYSGYAAGGLLFIGSALILLFPPLAVGSHAVLLSASAAELLTLAGAVSLAAYSSVHYLQRYFEEAVASRQFSDLFALLQDALGLPRAAPGTLAAPSVEEGMLSWAEPGIDTNLPVVYAVLAEPVGELDEQPHHAVQQALADALSADA
jgi:hypothetical protein